MISSKPFKIRFVIFFLFFVLFSCFPLGVIKSFSQSNISYLVDKIESSTSLPPAGKLWGKGPHRLGPKEREENIDNFSLRYCRDDLLGVRLLCDPRWSIASGKNALFFIISEEPRATLEIVKFDKRIKSINQLNAFYFEDLGYYQEGFSFEKAEYNSAPVIKVKAFSKDSPGMRLADYFFVNGESLYGIFFSVETEEEWDDYKFLFEDIARSVLFL